MVFRTMTYLGPDCPLGVVGATPKGWVVPLRGPYGGVTVTERVGAVAVVALTGVTGGLVKWHPLELTSGCLPGSSTAPRGPNQREADGRCTSKGGGP